MSAAKGAWWERFQSAIECERCGALPGQPCLTASGRVRSPHAARFYEALAFLRDRACPLHRIRDCSPLLNGCDLLTSAPEEAWGTP
jgi:hypothetical protein